MWLHGRKVLSKKFCAKTAVKRNLVRIPFEDASFTKQTETAWAALAAAWLLLRYIAASTPAVYANRQPSSVAKKYRKSQLNFSSDKLHPFFENVLNVFQHLHTRQLLYLPSHLNTGPHRRVCGQGLQGFPNVLVGILSGKKRLHVVDIIFFAVSGAGRNRSPLPTTDWKAESQERHLLRRLPK